VAAEPALREAVDAFLGDQPAVDWLQWGHLATSAACTLGDADSWERLSTRHIEVARASGALPPLAIAVAGRAMFAVWSGDLETAAELLAEEAAIKDATGIRMYAPGALLLAAYQGRPEESVPLLSSIEAEVIARGEGMGFDVANWATAILHNGLARYAEAAGAAEKVMDEPYDTNVTGWALAELIEGAARSGQTELARAAFARQSQPANVERAGWASGIAARSRALVTEGADAERWYVEAIEQLGRTPMRIELGRAQLLFGEWLRRGNRRVEARSQLRPAYELFAGIGAEAFAERARRELTATGEKVRRREVDTRNDLTDQEEHIARLARDGRTNGEIGAELFLSVRTVEWHLSKVFTKLGITTRRGLHDALPRRDR
jgi:DNA-binding CsgD family transcriptional regulator